MINIFIDFIILLMFQNDASLILVIVIVIIPIQLLMSFTQKISSKFICPRYDSDNIIEYDDYIECLNCGLHFSVDSLKRNIEFDNIVADEELDAFIKAFEGEDRNKLKDILKDEDEF